MHSSRMRIVRSSGHLWGGGGCLLQGEGVSAPGGVCSGGCLVGGVWSWGALVRGGVCSWEVSVLGGVSAPGWGGGVCSWEVSAPEGVSALGWVSALGGVYSGGCVVSHHALRQTPAPPCGQTNACKNIAFATSLRTVKTEIPIELHGNLFQGLHLSDFTDDPAEYKNHGTKQKILEASGGSRIFPRGGA